MRSSNYTGVSTDSRTIKKGNLFIALKGPNYDGHNFVLSALNKGASSAVVSINIPNIKNREALIRVADTLLYLQNLAHIHRQKLRTKVIAVTGSSGKTTTKDMIYSVLSQDGLTLKTQENLNNEIGVPLTLLKIEKKHKYAVIEMGMQNTGEIKELAKIARPNISVLTNIGEAHLAGLKTKENIAKAKSEIFNFLNKEDFAVLNADDPYFEYLKKQNKKAKVISFGLSDKADVRAVNIKETNNSVSFDLCSVYVIPAKAGIKIHIPLPGKHNVYNALAAVCVGIIYKVRADKIANGLSHFKPSSKRMDIFKTKNKIRIINDTYNANPSSMKAAIHVLSSQKNRHGSRRIAILGDMLELGKQSKYYHSEIGKEFNKSGIEILITIGSSARHIYLAAKKNANRSRHYHYFKDKEAALKKINTLVKPNDILLIKASRSAKLEDVVQYIM